MNVMSGRDDVASFDLSDHVSIWQCNLTRSIRHFEDATMIDVCRLLTSILVVCLWLLDLTVERLLRLLDLTVERLLVVETLARECASYPDVS